MRPPPREVPATVVIADDHPVLRGGVRALMPGAEFDVVAEAADAAQLMAAVSTHRPDLAVVDLHMPGADGAAMIRGIAEASPRTAIVVLTMKGVR